MGVCNDVMTLNVFTEYGRKSCGVTDLIFSVLLLLLLGSTTTTIIIIIISIAISSITILVDRVSTDRRSGDQKSTLPVKRHSIFRQEGMYFVSHLRPDDL